MSITRVSSTSPYAHEIGLSGVVRAGDLIVAAGISAISADGTVVGSDDPYHQTRACLAKALATISEVGASPADVIQTRLYLADAVDWQAVGRAHREIFAAARPAATMVVVTLLDPRILVEVELMACVDRTAPG